MKLAEGHMRYVVGVIGFLLSTVFLKGQNERSYIFDIFRYFSFKSINEIEELLKK